MPTKRPASFHRQIVEELGREICASDEAAASLPPEAMLCARFGVSRTIVREAVKSLVAKGLLDVRPKVGTTIRPRDQWNLLDPDVVDWQSGTTPKAQFIADLIELRRTIEPAAARLAAERAGPADLAAMRAALHRMAEAHAGRGEYVPADLAFHAAVLSACHNQFLRQMQSALGSIQRISFTLSTRLPNDAAASFPMHEALAEAVAAGDPDGAERATNALIVRAEANLRLSVCDLAFVQHTGGDPS